MSLQGSNLLDRDDLIALGIKYSKVHLWRLERQGKFPKRIRLSERKIVWSRSEIEHFQNTRAAERQGGAA